MKKGIFITGTDTGVGKTIVSATLARLLRLKGINVGVMKPATSGCSIINGKPVSDDAMLLCRSAGVACDHDTAPYLMKEPLAPAEAARIENLDIDFAHIICCYERIAAKHDFVIVEGAGGLMVPLSGMKTVADLAQAIDLPLIVVARPNLGTINHTSLTCMTARQLGLKVTGVIINNFPELPSLAEQSAAHYISGLCQTPVIGTWPHYEGTNEYETVEYLADRLANMTDSTALFNLLGFSS